ncbi:hypothetical protein [Chondromyces apiculatus]|uniref:Uncharacterized protein n=1 Tax=Chondromyces apiculatus DSM 436 TaxID=1192034 RepID=A0A017TG15_9BACT|nr:hypothetical protein [Chondromyces apiculatus]EYF07765.1 Hypothetical protein CAP_7714 [Chondromyces apiculatus DSM 436]
MHCISTFTLAPLSSTGPDGLPCSELVQHGKPTGLRLPGVSLDGQFTVHPGVLLLVKDDVPHDECLQLFLLSPRLAVLEEAELGAPYTPGLVRGLAPDAEGCDLLDFSFAGEELRLQVHGTPRRMRDGLLQRPLRRLLAPKYLAIFAKPRAARASTGQHA